MTKKAAPAGRYANAANQDLSPDQKRLRHWSSERHAAEVVVADLAHEGIDVDGVREKVSAVFSAEHVTSVIRVVFSRIGEVVPDSSNRSQALVDKFLTLRAGLEEWARHARVRVDGGYLRQVGEDFSAIFELVPEAELPAMLTASVKVGDGAGSQAQPRKSKRTR